MWHESIGRQKEGKGGGRGEKGKAMGSEYGQSIYILEIIFMKPSIMYNTFMSIKYIWGW